MNHDNTPSGRISPETQSAPPSHWRVLPLKQAVRLLTGKASSKRNPVALENIESWTGNIVDTETLFEGEGVAFCANDVLFGKIRPYLAKVAVMETNGEAVGEFFVMRPRPDVLAKYLAYQLRTREFISVVDGSTYGTKMPRANWQHVGPLRVMIPPIEEQETIAVYLDSQTAIVDAIIAEQSNLTRLLEEKRKMLIYTAVTKGLNPLAPHKDSGELWLGKVPHSWHVRPLQTVAHVINGYPFDASLFEPNGGYSLLRIRDLNQAVTACTYTGPFVAEAAVDSSDLLIGMDGDFNIGRWLGDGPALLNQRMCCVRLTDSLLRSFLYYALAYPLKAINDITYATTVKHLSASQIRKIRVGIPESRNELARIVNYLDKETAKIDSLLAEQDRLTALLKEKRSALVTAAVTGKLQVASQLAKAA